MGLVEEAEPRLGIVCLGVGKGTTHVLRGESSTAFAVVAGDETLLLVDCGGGVIRACRDHLAGGVPATIYLTHNHLDHTGDLPIAIHLLASQGRRPRLLGHRSVLELVRNHRLHELPERLVAGVDWLAADAEGQIMLDGRLSLRLFRSAHSYVCFGFELWSGNRLLLGYTGDSALSPEVHHRVGRAPLAVVDGRRVGNHDHASFAELDRVAKDFPGCAWRIVHYEEAEGSFSAANIRFWQPGERLPLAADPQV